MSRAGGNDAVLGQGLKDLLTHWERAGSSWKDAARRDFDKDYIQELAYACRSACSAIQQIEELLRQVRKECGD